VGIGGKIQQAYDVCYVKIHVQMIIKHDMQVITNYAGDNMIRRDNSADGFYFLQQMKVLLQMIFLCKQMICRFQP